MEILQTIWSALTTENEVLVKATSIPMVFLEAAVTTLLFTTILNIESNRKQKFIYIISFSLISFISIYFIPGPYNTFINVLACPILVYLIFRTTILKSILAEIIPYIFFVILSSLLIILCVKITNLDADYFLQIPLYKMSFSLLLYLLAYLLYLICNKFNINIKLLDKMRKRNNLTLLFNLIIGIIAIFIQAYIVAVYINKLPIVITLSSLIVLLLYFAINIYSLSRTNKLEITTESLEEERLYNKTLTILYDNIRGFKHDFNNIVQAIGGYISTNDMEGLKGYYSDLMADCQKANNLAILNPELINNPAIYSLLTSKYHKAEELGIKINFDVFLDLTTLNIKTYHLSRILGILLDNAIEASSKCEEKIINVTIRKDNKANRQLFVIENTYSNKEVDTEKIFEKGYTSKLESDGNNHGLGLWEVRKILKKSNNLNLFTTKNDKLFKQQLEIYC